VTEPSAERREFYERLAARSAKPLWEVLANLIPPEPRPSAQPVLWRYEDLRPLLIESGEVITAQEAGRRVLILENPGLRGTSLITESLYAGLQLVTPGEVTSIHRHTATAIRFVIESEGGYTAVNGERAYMQPGDFVVTPSWMAHDHGNPASKPVVWLDVLDLAMVNLFNTSFAEDVAPDAPKPPLRKFAYPYPANRQALAQCSLDPHRGKRMFYDISQGYPMPTMGAFLALLPAGFRGRPVRSTDSTIYCCAEGQGRTLAGDVTLEWREHDIFVIPSWTHTSHEADGDAVLFGISDRPAQQALGLWREELG
jgi:gentisate 1,2-dioxygenase